MKPLPIHRSFSGPMAAANFCFPLTAQKPAKTKWLANRQLYLGNINGYKRILAHVYIPTMYGKRFFLMDAVTGTLYRRKDGRCATSDTLRLLGLTKEAGLSKKLLTMRISDVAGDDE